MSRRRGGFPAYLVTGTLARCGTESASPALLIVTIAVVGSAATGSFVVACLTASAAFAGPVVGAVIDRSRHVARAFAITMLTTAAGLAAIAILIGVVPVAIIMALAVVAGLGYPAITGAWSAQVPRIVEPGGLSRAYSADAATYSVASVAAPPVAAALIAVSVHAPLWLPVVLLAIAVLTLPRVPVQPTPTPSTQSLAADLRTGIRAMFGTPSLVRTVLITTIAFAGIAALYVASPLIAQNLFGGLGYSGLILGAFAVGSVLSALWITRHPISRPDRAVIGGTAASGLMLLGVGLAPTPWLVLVFAFAMGASEPPIMSAMFQVRVRETTPRVQAQVFTTSASLRMTAYAAATAVCGLLVGVGTLAVITFGVLLHVSGIVIGLLAGPQVPHRSTWRGPRPEHRHDA